MNLPKHWIEQMHLYARGKIVLEQNARVAIDYGHHDQRSAGMVGRVVKDEDPEDEGLVHVRGDHERIYLAGGLDQANRLDPTALPRVTRGA